MDEHERMLAEGPRVAPEPQTAEFDTPVEAPQAKPRSSTQSAPAPRRGSRAQYLRLLPLAALLLFFVGRAAGLGQAAFAFFVAAIFVSLIVRSRLRRR